MKKDEGDTLALIKSVVEMEATQKPLSVPKPDNRQSVLKEFLSLGVRIAAIAIIAAIMLTFFYSIHIVSDPGMMPVVQNGDVVIISRLGRNYNINDLVILDFEGTRQIRRVLAKEGDEVDITEQGLVTNGALQSDPHAQGETWALEEGVEFPLTVPEGELFVLGDAREMASDSRIYGTVRTRDTHGRVITIIRRRNL